MPGHIDSRRRWFGMLFLLIAGGMLIWGLTVFSGRLKGMGFIIYWLICFFFTGLALFTALLDLLIVRHRQREEQRNLIVKAIEDLEARKKKKAGSSSNQPGKRRPK